MNLFIIMIVQKFKFFNFLKLHPKDVKNDELHIVLIAVLHCFNVQSFI